MNKIREAPDHHDADLVLKLYDLRREPVMRQSRDAMGKFFPRTWEDVLAVTKPDHPHNTAWRRWAATSRWPMASPATRRQSDFLARAPPKGCSCSPRCSRSCSSTAPSVAVGVQQRRMAGRQFGRGQAAVELFQKRVRTMIETADALQARTTARATGSPPRDR